MPDNTKTLETLAYPLLDYLREHNRRNDVILITGDDVKVFNDVDNITYKHRWNRWIRRK